MSKIEGSIGPAGLGFGPDAQLIVQNPATQSSFSLQNAIDECVPDKGDVILITRGYQAPSATVNFDCVGISVYAQDPFGMSPHARGEFQGIDPVNTDGPAARITAYCHLVGLGFFGNQGSGDTVNASLILDASGGGADGWGTWLKHCRFGNWARAAGRYGVFNMGMAAVTLDHCTFSGGAASNPLAAGILHDEHITGGGGRPGEVNTIGCRYEHCTYAHEVKSGSRVVNSVWDREIMGFNLSADAWVKFLKLNVLGGGGAVHGAHIMDCHFPTAKDTGTFSHDKSQLITEGYQFSGDHYGSDISQILTNTG